MNSEREYPFRSILIAVFGLIAALGCSREGDYVPPKTQSANELPSTRSEDADGSSLRAASASENQPPARPDPEEEKNLSNFQDLGIQIQPKSNELPTGFPEDVPVPDGGRIELYIAEPLNVLFKVPSSFATISQTYPASLAKAGWTHNKTLKGKGNTTTLSYGKGDRKMEVEISENLNGTFVTLNLTSAR